MITIENLLQYRCFQDGKLIAGQGGQENEVNGVLTMEAPDIDLWGRKGLLVLTSYFALQDISSKELNQFFYTAKKVGIAGFVVKLERLIPAIPAVFISRCNEHLIPLIQIDRRTSYEKITNEILKTLINREAYELQNYYETHQSFTHLMMNQPELSHILDALKTMIAKPVTLLEKNQEQAIETDAFLGPYKILENGVFFSTQQSKLSYKKDIVQYASFQPEKNFIQWKFPVKNPGYEDYELLVHELDLEMDEIDLRTIENAVIALRIELTKQTAIKQDQRFRLNELGSDFLHGRLNTQNDIDEAVSQLQLNPEKNHRVILFRFLTEKENTKAEELIISHFIHTVIYRSKQEFPERIYITRKQSVVFIIPTDSLDLAVFKRKLTDLRNQLLKNRLSAGFKVYITISSECSLKNITTAYRQAFDSQKLFSLMENKQTVIAYDDLGIYQIFLEEKNYHSLNRFVPDNIQRLNKENLELFHTLSIFLNTNQSYSEAATKLFVHPKTVRYRVESLQENYQIDLYDSEKILHYHIGIRLLKYFASIKHSIIQKEERETT